MQWRSVGGWGAVVLTGAKVEGRQNEFFEGRLNEEKTVKIEELLIHISVGLM
jgi:hypothetical protein